MGFYVLPNLKGHIYYLRQVYAKSAEVHLQALQTTYKHYLANTNIQR